MNIGAWLIMMIVLMPMAGAGLFGANLGMMTLVMHVIYGVVLGGVYGLERPEQAHELHTSR